MRWNSQELGEEQQNALPGLAKLNNFVRTVRTPEFAGITFHEILARSALNKVPGGGGALPFGWTINPYRGCSHACAYCLDPETLILMGDGRQQPLWQVQVGDEIYGTKTVGNYRRYVKTQVLASWNTRKRAFRVTIADGTQIVASADHRFLTDRGWKYVCPTPSGAGQRPFLTTNNKLMGFGLRGLAQLYQPGHLDPEYGRGYLTGMIRGDGCLFKRDDGRRNGNVNHLNRFRLALKDAEALNRSRFYVEQIGVRTHTWVYVRASETRSAMNAIHTARRADFDRITSVIRWPDEPTARRKGGFLAGIFDAAVKSEAKLQIVSIEDLGETIDMIDITTQTGDFIANGVISHNCFARPTHKYLDFNMGTDFDSEIIVKVNVAEVLEKELAKPSWQRHPVALGTNTDPYQRAEGRYALMPGIIAALTHSGTPFSILTKGTLLRRDLDLLADAATHVPVDLAMSIAIYDDELQQSVEPGTPSTKARLATVTAVREHGLGCCVFMMPILPFLTDTREHLDEAMRQAKAAGATSVLYTAMHLKPGVKEWFMFWLEREHPELVERYQVLYGDKAYAPVGYRKWLSARIKPLIAGHRLVRGEEDPATGGVRSTSLGSFALGESAAGESARGVTRVTFAPTEPTRAPTLF